MKPIVGLRVSQERCAVCILEEDGAPVFEGDCAKDADAIADTISELRKSRSFAFCRMTINRLF